MSCFRGVFALMTCYELHFICCLLKVVSMKVQDKRLVVSVCILSFCLGAKTTQRWLGIHIILQCKKHKTNTVTWATMTQSKNERFGWSYWISFYWEQVNWLCLNSSFWFLICMAFVLPQSVISFNDRKKKETRK